MSSRSSSPAAPASAKLADTVGACRTFLRHGGLAQTPADFGAQVIGHAPHGRLTINQPRGLSGVPSFGHCTAAASSASWTASSAAEK